MSTLSAQFPTLVDVAQETGADGNLLPIAEILQGTNEMIQDIPWYECNDGMGHKTVVRTGYPTGTFRKLNQGVPAEKGTTTPLRFSTAMLESYSKPDAALVNMSGGAAYRSRQDRAAIIGMGKTFSSKVIYGNDASTPEEFTGLAAFFAAISGVESGENIINAGGAGSDNTSIYVVNWGPEAIYGVYPRGSKAGLTHTDKGQLTERDSNQNSYEAYVSHFKWDCGLVVSDWTRAARIANIDTSDLDTISNTPNLINWLVMALERVEAPDGKVAIYCNKKIREKLRLGALNKASSQLTFENVGGHPVVSFSGAPVRRVDALLNTEAAIS